jgi:hypothetical protein
LATETYPNKMPYTSRPNSSAETSHHIFRIAYEGEDHA